MRRHGTNFTAVAAILGGTALGAGATMALASANHGERHRHGRGGQQTIIVCESEGGASASSSVTVHGTKGEASVVVTEQRPSRDRRHVRKRRRCRRIVTTEFGQHQRVDRIRLHADGAAHAPLEPPHFDQERIRLRIEEARMRSEEARMRAQEVRARAQEVRARAQEVGARAQEVQTRAQEAQTRAQEARTRAQEVQARAERLRQVMKEWQDEAGSDMHPADLERLRERLRAALAEFGAQRDSPKPGTGN